MMRVTVELVPEDGRARHRVLAVAVIANDGSGSEERGNYAVRLSKVAPHLGETWKTARVVGFPRKRFGAWDLLLAGLVEALGTRVDHLVAALPELASGHPTRDELLRRLEVRASELPDREPGQEG